jgi:hypothetical protein
MFPGIRNALSGHTRNVLKRRRRGRLRRHLQRRRQPVAVHLVRRIAIPFALSLQHTSAVRASLDRSILYILESLEIVAWKPRPVPEPRPLRSAMATANPVADETDATASRDPTPSFMKPLVKDLEEVARNLELAAMEFRANHDGPYNPDMLFIGAGSFLPCRMISQITDNFLQIESEDNLKRRMMEGWRYWDTYGSELWNVVAMFPSKLRDTLEARHEEKLAKQREAREKK